MPSRFVIKQNSDDNSLFFCFVNSENETILLSADYEDKAAIEAAITDVKLNSLISQQLAGGKTKDGAQFFVIKGSDGHILVKSVLYTDQMAMDNALHCVKDNCCIAETEDLTELAA